MIKVNYTASGRAEAYNAAFPDRVPLSEKGGMVGGEGRHPTFEGNVEDLPGEWSGRFDLILADPPYSTADAGKYGPPMYNRRKVLAELHRVTADAGNLVWLDQSWPMHRKDQWKTWGTVGLVRSTQHRMRLVTFFSKQSS